MTRLTLVVAMLLSAAPLLGDAANERQEPHRMSPLDRAICGVFSGERPIQSLTRFGAEAIPVLVDSLAAGEVECSGTGRAFTADEQVALLTTLGELNRADVTSHLRRETVLAPSREMRSASLRILGEIGRPNDLGWMIRLATPENEKAPIERDLARDLQHSIERLLQRNPEPTLATLSSLMRAVRVELTPHIARAAAARPSDGTLPFLIHCLTDTPEVDAVVLTHLGRAASKSRRPVDEQVVTNVRSLLFFGQPQVKREACLVLGHFEDYESIPELIRALADDDRGVRTNARWALARISDLDFGAKPERWDAWHTDQSAWWTERAPALVNDLRSSNAIIATRAINDLTGRQFRRHEVARELVFALQSVNEGTVLHACSALGQLRSMVAVDALVECLAHPDEGIQQSAWAALKSITGWSLPLDRHEWASAVKETQ